MSSAFRSAWARGGVLELYKGLGATLALDLPFALVQFPCFEYIRYALARARGPNEEGRLTPNSLDAAMAGAAQSHGQR